MRRHPSYRGEPDVSHPPFAATSAARLRVPQEFTEGEQELNEVVGEIEYSEEDEKVLEEWVRKTVATSWHPIGTCAMKPRENGGVVDKDLNVYGTSGLKIADMGICPKNCGFHRFFLLRMSKCALLTGSRSLVSCNTYSAASMIGEKAAVIFAKELGFDEAKLQGLARFSCSDF
jgi:alcohol oxidase